MSYKENYEKWCSYDFLDKETKKDLEAMKNDEELKEDCFYDNLAFGTAGMRGVMGTGTNRFNIYMVRRATQGFANFIKKKGKEKDGVVVIYDSRNNSKKYALETALTFCANGIKVWTFKSLRPTPFLSFVIREKKAFGGINITASHNSKEYNGYKLYLSDGAQFSYPDDEMIISEVSKITDLKECKTMDEKTAIKKGLLKYIDGDIDEKFRKKAESILINKDMVKRYGKELKIVYTPLHGTGSFFLNKAFKEVGFSNVSVVKEQDDKNGDFKTVKKPNPEDPAAFTLALNLAKEKDADIVMATDPDADRIGVYVKTKDGEYKPLTGNDMAAILSEYIMFFAKYKNVDMRNAYMVKSFVTTKIMDAIAKYYGIDIITTLTGFKWIGKEIKNNKKLFLYGAEESYGSLCSDYVRDKDAISTTLMICEIALAFKKFPHLNLIEVLHLLYKKYGTYKNYNQNLDFPGVEGKAEMKDIMTNFRDKPFTKLTDIDVVRFDDYLNDISKDFKTNETHKLGVHSNDSLVYHLADNSTLTIRPSGTEPKIKIYYDIVDENETLAENKFLILKQAMTKLLNGGF